MQQGSNRTKNQIYDEHMYTQWNQLPPNLPIPNAPQVPVLFLSLHKILYLNQITDSQPVQLKLEWWGMQKPQVAHLNQQDQKTVQLKYIVCCPLQGLLSYLTDTKLLSVDVLIKRKSIGKAYLNFTVLKGWRGQMYEGMMDIKQSKKKIGQISFSIQIKLQNNPYLNVEAKKRRDNVSIIKKVPETHKYVSYNDLSNKKFSEQGHNSSQNVSKENLLYVQKSSRRDAVIQSERERSIQLINDSKSVGRSIIDMKQKSYKVIYKPEVVHNFPLTEAQNNKVSINYQKQIISLVEDFNYMFQKNHQSMLVHEFRENMIEIQILKLQIANKVEERQQIEVSMPLPNGQTNIYKIVPGSFVKVCIGQQLNKQQLFSYLKNSEMQFTTVNKIQGSIKLSKVLAKCRQVIEIALFQKDKKDLKPKQKGICQIRIIPPQPQNDKEKAHQESLNQKKNLQTIDLQKQPIKNQPIVEQYVSLFVKRFIPLQDWNRKANLSIQIVPAEGESSLLQTKTVWNRNEQFRFDDKLTFKIIKNTALGVNLVDRQQKQIKIGEGELKMVGPIGVNVQIPIHSKHMNKKITIGYLELDYVKNGLNSVTKLVDILSRTVHVVNSGKQEKQEPHQQVQQEKIGEQEKQSNHNYPEQQTYNQKQMVNIEETKLQNQENRPLDLNQKQKPLVKTVDRNLCSLQIFNIFFTFLYSNTHLLQPLQNKTQIKITEFLDIFSELQTNNILSLRQLNIIISKHLFSSRQSERINKINLEQLKNSYEAFCTYYQDLVEERDNVLKEFLGILQNVGFSINDLQYKLKSNQQIWSKMNQFLSLQKNSNINIVEDIRRYYSQQQDVKYYTGLRQITAAQFCDTLRRFEVYETTLGEKISYKIAAAQIYHHICEVLIDLQPYIEEYTYRELINLLQNEQIILSSWEKQNIQGYLSTKQKQPRFAHPIPQSLKPSENKIPREHNQQLRQLEKPTISKSPTFGYLHAPEALKGEIIINDNYMVDSLGAKMINLPISPINFNSSKQNTQNLKIVFTNLKYNIKSFSVDGNVMNLNSVNLTHSKNLSKNQHNRLNQIHSQSQQQQQINQISENKTFKSIDYASRKQYQSGNSQQEGRNMEVSLQQINKKFNYQVQIDFGQHQYIKLQCLHEEWTALVTQDGDYLGTILVY